MKDRKVYESCFGRHYDAKVNECKGCEVAKECRIRLVEYGKVRGGGSVEKGLTNPYRSGTVQYLCYESLKQGGTFKELTLRVEEELKKREAKCASVSSRLRLVLFGCRHGKIHGGGEFVHSTETKIYKVTEK